MFSAVCSKCLETAFYTSWEKILEENFHLKKHVFRNPFRTVREKIGSFANVFWRWFQNCILSVSRKLLGKNFSFERSYFHLFWTVSENCLRFWPTLFGWIFKTAFFTAKATIWEKYNFTWRNFYNFFDFWVTTCCHFGKNLSAALSQLHCTCAVEPLKETILLKNSFFSSFWHRLGNFRLLLVNFWHGFQKCILHD